MLRLGEPSIQFIKDSNFDLVQVIGYDYWRIYKEYYIEEIQKLSMEYLKMFSLSTCSEPKIVALFSILFACYISFTRYGNALVADNNTKDWGFTYSDFEFLHYYELQSFGINIQKELKTCIDFVNKLKIELMYIRREEGIRQEESMINLMIKNINQLKRIWSTITLEYY